MSDIGWIIVITAVAGVGGTGLGGAVGALLKRDSSRIVSLLLAFAGGIMTGVVCFDMISGALEPDGATEPVSVFFVVAGVLFGYVVIWLLNLWIDKKTPTSTPTTPRRPTTWTSSSTATTTSGTRPAPRTAARPRSISSSSRAW